MSKHAKSLVNAADISTTIAEIQQEHVATKQPGEPLLTGVELAASLHAMLPPAPSAGTKYIIRERIDPNQTPVTVTSPDGSIEDAVRVFNANRKEIRTAKQLVIEKVAA